MQVRPNAVVPCDTPTALRGLSENSWIDQWGYENGRGFDIMHGNGMETFPYKIVHRLLAADATSACAMMCCILSLAVAFSHPVFAADSVKVSDFGWDAVDSTRQVQA